MKQTARTPYGAYVQYCNTVGATIVPDLDNTMNKMYGVKPTDIPTDGTATKLQYVAIGNGGYAGTSSPSDYVAGTRLSASSYRRRNDAMSLYNDIPWIARPVNGDLDGVEKTLYRMRVVKKINGRDIAFYFLRKILEPTAATMHKVDVKTGESTGLYRPPANSLKPQYPTEDSSVSHLTTVSGAMVLDFSAKVKAEIKAANSLWYGEPGHDVIKEIGLYTGADVDNEALCATLSHSLNVGDLLTQVSDTEDGTISIDIGTMDNFYTGP